jgi:integrase
LDTATETKTVTGENSQKPQFAAKGKIVEFAWWMQKQGYAPETILNRGYMLKRLVALGADLANPESVKEILAQQKWTESYKAINVDAYNLFLKWQGLTWEQPRYRITTPMAFIPTEKELDDFIAAATKTKSIFLQGLKDTGCDPGELGALRWIDVNTETRTVTVNFPVKGHNKRVIAVSEQFLRKIGSLPRHSERVFNYRAIRENFFLQRKVIARKLENPRILEISFTTFRHWKGTMEFHKTKDLLHVQRLLGHKKIDNTLIYIDYEKAVYGDTNAEEFTSRVAANTQEACSLIEAGFEYVTGEYNDGGKIFRKRK